MIIKFMPPFHMEEAIVFDLGAIEAAFPGISVWTYGEEKVVTDEMKVRRNGEYIPAVEILLDHKFFKVVTKDGKAVNPFRMCSLCGVETDATSIPHPKNPIFVPCEIRGERVCANCFDNTPHHWTPEGVEFPEEDLTNANNDE